MAALSALVDGSQELAKLDVSGCLDSPDSEDAMRQPYACAAIGLALLLSGCGGGGTIFALKDPGYAVKPT